MLQRMYNLWVLSSLLLCYPRNMEMLVMLCTKGAFPHSCRIKKLFWDIINSFKMWMMHGLENEPMFCLATEGTGSVPAVHDQDANIGQLHLYLVSNSPNRMSTLVLKLYLFRLTWTMRGSFQPQYSAPSSTSLIPVVHGCVTGQSFLWEAPFLVIHLYFEPVSSCLKHCQRATAKYYCYECAWKSQRVRIQGVSHWGTTSLNKQKVIPLSTFWTGNLCQVSEMIVKWKWCFLSVGHWICSLMHQICFLSEFFHFKRCGETHQSFAKLSDRSFVCWSNPFRRCPLCFLEPNQLNCL